MPLPRCILLCLSLSVTFAGHAQQTIDWWMTTADKSHLLAKQTQLTFGSQTGQPGQQDSSTIIIDPFQTFQSIDGFGFALTGGSAQALYRMSPAARKQLLQELFGSNAEGVSISYLRL